MRPCYCIQQQFLLIAENIPLFEYTTIFIHLPIDGQLGCFQFWAIMNEAAMSICVQVFCGHIFPLFLLGEGLETNLLRHLSSTCCFFIRNCHILSKNCCTILLFHQLCMNSLVAVYLHQHLILLIFLILAILVGGSGISLYFNLHFPGH